MDSNTEQAEEHKAPDPNVLDSMSKEQLMKLKEELIAERAALLESPNAFLSYHILNMDTMENHFSGAMLKLLGRQVKQVQAENPTKSQEPSPAKSQEVTPSNGQEEIETIIPKQEPEPSSSSSAKNEDSLTLMTRNEVVNTNISDSPITNTQIIQETLNNKVLVNEPEAVEPQESTSEKAVLNHNTKPFFKMLTEEMKLKYDIYKGHTNYLKYLSSSDLDKIGLMILKNERRLPPPRLTPTLQTNTGMLFGKAANLMLNYTETTNFQRFLLKKVSYEAAAKGQKLMEKFLIDKVSYESKIPSFRRGMEEPKLLIRREEQNAGALDESIKSAKVDLVSHLKEKFSRIDDLSRHIFKNTKYINVITHQMEDFYQQVTCISNVIINVFQCFIGSLTGSVMNDRCYDNCFKLSQGNLAYLAQSKKETISEIVMFLEKEYISSLPPSPNISLFTKKRPSLVMQNNIMGINGLIEKLSELSPQDQKQDKNADNFMVHFDNMYILDKTLQKQLNYMCYLFYSNRNVLVTSTQQFDGMQDRFFLILYIQYLARNSELSIDSFRCIQDNTEKTKHILILTDQDTLDRWKKDIILWYCNYNKRVKLIVTGEEKQDNNTYDVEIHLLSFNACWDNIILLNRIRWMLVIFDESGGYGNSNVIFNSYYKIISDLQSSQKVLLSAPLDKDFSSFGNILSYFQRFSFVYPTIFKLIEGKTPKKPGIGSHMNKLYFNIVLCLSLGTIQREVFKKNESFCFKLANPKQEKRRRKTRVEKLKEPQQAEDDSIIQSYINNGQTNGLNGAKTCFNSFTFATPSNYQATSLPLFSKALKLILNLFAISPAYRSTQNNILFKSINYSIDQQYLEHLNTHVNKTLNLLSNDGTSRGSEEKKQTQLKEMISQLSSSFSKFANINVNINEQEERKIFDKLQLNGTVKGDGKFIPSNLSFSIYEPFITSGENNEIIFKGTRIPSLAANLFVPTAGKYLIKSMPSYNRYYNVASSLMSITRVENISVKRHIIARYREIHKHMNILCFPKFRTTKIPSVQKYKQKFPESFVNHLYSGAEGCTSSSLPQRYVKVIVDNFIKELKQKKKRTKAPGLEEMNPIPANQKENTARTLTIDDVRAKLIRRYVKVQLEMRESSTNLYGFSPYDDDGKYANSSLFTTQSREVSEPLTDDLFELLYDPEVFLGLWKFTVPTLYWKTGKHTNFNIRLTLSLFPLLGIQNSRALRYYGKLFHLYTDKVIVQLPNEHKPSTSVAELNLKTYNRFNEGGTERMKISDWDFNRYDINVRYYEKIFKYLTFTACGFINPVNYCDILSDNMFSIQRVYSYSKNKTRDRYNGRLLQSTANQLASVGSTMMSTYEMETLLYETDDILNNTFFKYCSYFPKQRMYSSSDTYENINDGNPNFINLSKTQLRHSNKIMQLLQLLPSLEEDVNYSRTLIICRSKATVEMLFNIFNARSIKYYYNCRDEGHKFFKTYYKEIKTISIYKYNQLKQIVIVTADDFINSNKLFLPFKHHIIGNSGSHNIINIILYDIGFHLTDLGANNHPLCQVEQANNSRFVLEMNRLIDAYRIFTMAITRNYKQSESSPLIINQINIFNFENPVISALINETEQRLIGEFDGITKANLTDIINAIVNSTVSPDTIQSDDSNEAQSGLSVVPQEFDVQALHQERSELLKDVNKEFSTPVLFSLFRSAFSRLYEKSQKVYAKLTDHEVNMIDYINYMHVLNSFAPTSSVIIDYLRDMIKGLNKKGYLGEKQMIRLCEFVSYYFKLESSKDNYSAIFDIFHEFYSSPEFDRIVEIVQFNSRKRQSRAQQFGETFKFEIVHNLPPEMNKIVFSKSELVLDYLSSQNSHVYVNSEAEALAMNIQTMLKKRFEQLDAKASTIPIFLLGLSSVFSSNVSLIHKTSSDSRYSILLFLVESYIVNRLLSYSYKLLDNMIVPNSFIFSPLEDRFLLGLLERTPYYSFYNDEYKEPINFQDVLLKDGSIVRGSQDPMRSLMVVKSFPHYGLKYLKTLVNSLSIGIDLNHHTLAAIKVRLRTLSDKLSDSKAKESKDMILYGQRRPAKPQRQVLSEYTQFYEHKSFATEAKKLTNLENYDPKNDLQELSVTTNMTSYSVYLLYFAYNSLSILFHHYTRAYRYVQCDEDKQTSNHVLNDIMKKYQIIKDDTDKKLGPPEEGKDDMMSQITRSLSLFSKTLTEEFNPSTQEQKPQYSFMEMVNALDPEKDKDLYDLHNEAFRPFIAFCQSGEETEEARRCVEYYFTTCMY